MASPNEENINENHSFNEERVLWKNEVKTGIIHRRVIETQIVTTQRVIKNNYTIRLEDIIDIVITNQQRISNSQYTGYRPKYSYTSFGTSTSRSKTIGDVIFFHSNGETDFHQLENPQNISRIVKAARKKILFVYYNKIFEVLGVGLEPLFSTCGFIFDRYQINLLLIKDIIKLSPNRNLISLEKD